MADSTVGGVKSMVLTGDQDVRIDMTNMLNQITGLDLNGNGTIANDGKENSATVKAASGYVAVDAYTRLVNGVVNETDLTKVFLGDIKYDGTGFAGDGIKTNGNVVLGGLGADTILGGLGNDFLASGGVALSRAAATESLSGGRNADFLFAELSLLSNTDGNKLFIDGGATADNTSAANGQSAQDSDWLLLQASDDDERIEVVLTENAGTVGTTPVNDGTLVTRAGQYATLRDIENIDASGNTYGFLKNLSTAVGGAPTGAVNPNNNGIGSSGQLNITGSAAANIIIGGYDNDAMNGAAGNDILMGGNLNMLIDPNLVGLVGNNDGRDEITGGAGSDNIAFEADGGVIEGGATVNTDDGEIDTLWLTANSLGATKAAGVAVVPVAASTLTTDSTIRLDLAAGKVGGLANASGYGGADLNAATGNFTADQTNYNVASAGLRVQAQDMENVIATGLGAIDFKAAGANTATDLTFDNQQNFKGYAGNLDLRGEAGANILYASNGADTLEGRAGGTYFYNSAAVVTDTRDKLSGGNGLDTFVFGTQDGSGAAAQAAYGDNIDVIHRQRDANGDNIWDNYSATTGVGDFEQDFGLDTVVSQSASALRLTLNVSAADTVSNPLVANDVVQINVTVAGAAKVLTTAGMAAAPTMAALLIEVQSALTTLGDANLSATLTGNTISIIDASGRALGGSGYIVAQNSGGSFANIVAFEPTIISTAKDVLLFKAYEDRSDNEAVNDNAGNGSSITLGVDSYAQDRVVSFAADGTRIAEDQQYRIVFDNLTTQDVATITVNGVQYQLTVGVDLDGNPIAGEDVTSGATQAAIQNAFLVRLNGFINSFMDSNTAAGSVNSTLATTTVANDTLVLIQNVYGSSNEQTVFMNAPVVSLGNQSGGQPATWTVENRANHEVLLFNFDGRNGLINGENVKFIGDTGANRSLLATAKTAGETIVGYEASVVDSGANDLQASVTNTAVNGVPATTPVTAAAVVTDNTNTNSFLQVNFAVHGDDLLMGGAGNDTIFGRTGDDRVMGSLGTDTVDGGKNWYAVQVLNETQARVVEMNAWEAASPAARVTALTGLLISSTTQILQTENGTAAPIAAWDGVNAFDDTLQFQQSDVAATARFKVTIGATDFSTTTTGAGAAAVVAVALPKGGAGTVAIDVAGDGAWDAGQLTTFSNFENIRTVSGTGRAVAGPNGGQGNDTLDVSALSTATGGIRYELSNNAATAGEVRYDTTAAAVAATAAQASGNFGLAAELIISIDGVENVTTGTGKDYLIIDESEAAKNNTFDASTGVDVIDYQNDYSNGVTALVAASAPNVAGVPTAAAATESAAEPTVAIKVNTATETDTVTMTGGRVGATGALDTPTDTLVNVEVINLNLNTARGSSEADSLDVTMIVAGAAVDYTQGQVRTAGSLVGTNVQVTIGNIAQLERVTAGEGSDTVLVASSATMGANASSDDTALASNRKDLSLATFLDYNELTTTGARAAFTSLAAASNDAGAGKIEDWLNQGQFKFNMGAGAGIDTVDYSNATDAIAVRVEMNAAVNDQLVLVDSTAGVFGGGIANTDRVDVLTGAEKIVAARGESVLDLTQATVNTKVEFSKFDVAGQVAALDRDVYTVVISDNTDSTRPVALNRAFVEYRDAGLSTTITQNTALWTRIEGADVNDTIVMSSAHSVNGTGSTNTMTLRGGQNEVKYNELTKSISLSLAVTDFDATSNATKLASGLITGTVTFQDGTGNNVVGPTLANSGTHTITSFTANNTIDAKNTDAITTNNSALTIVASVDAEDSLTLTGATDKLFVLAETGVIDNQITVKLGSGAAQNSIILKGFELLQDAASNDVYDMGTLTNVFAGLTFSDTAGDHDTIVVPAGTTSWNGSAALTLDLDTFNTTKALGGFGMDFDVLDASKLTTSGLTLDGTADAVSDEVVIGALSLITTISTFESVVMTNASVAAGTTFNLNTTTNKLTQGSTSVNFGGTTNADNVLSFGGLVFEGELGNSYVPAVAVGVTVTATDVGAEGVEFVGGDGADTLTGAAGADKLVGGAGNDVLNAGVATEVRTMNVTGVMSAAAGGSVAVTFNGFSSALTTVTEGTEVVVGAGNDAVGAALALKINANLAAINAGAAWALGAALSAAAYDATSDQLTFTFVSGVNVAQTITAAVAGDAGTIAVSAETAVDGGDGGANILRGGAGADTVNGGAGADALVVVGSTTTAQAAAYAIAYANQAAVDAVIGGTNVIARSELTTVGGSSATDVTAGDVYNGGAGFDTLHMFGTVSLAGSTVNADIEVIATHSDLTITATQLAAMTAAGTRLTFDTAGSSLTITGLSGTVAALDLSAILAGSFANVTVLLPGVTAVTALTAAGAITLYAGTPTTPGTALAAPALTTVYNSVGTAGGDALTGTANADKIFGFDGNDTITGGAGADTLNGGADTDTLSYADITVDTSHGHAAALITGVAINNTTATITAATVAAAAGGTVVLGGGAAAAGTDLLAGTVGYLSATAAASLTTMVRDTITGFETLTGSTLNDVIYGGAGAETINGGAGTGIDYIKGGAGADTMVGGGGNDIFAFGASSETGVVATGNIDRLSDFGTTSDKIVGLGVAGITAGEFTAVAGTTLDTYAIALAAANVVFAATPTQSYFMTSYGTAGVSAQGVLFLNIDNNATADGAILIGVAGAQTMAAGSLLVVAGDILV